MEENNNTPEEMETQVADDTPELDEGTVLAPGKKFSARNILSMLSSAVRGGELTTRQAAEFRSQFGIPNSVFTTKKRDKNKVRAARKRAKAARRVNRGLTKGQKRTGGDRRYVAKT
jgi:hypothetical protein